MDAELPHKYNWRHKYRAPWGEAGKHQEVAGGGFIGKVVGELSSGHRQSCPGGHRVCVSAYAGRGPWMSFAGCCWHQAREQPVGENFTSRIVFKLGN